MNRSSSAKCRYCGESILFVVAESGRRMPIDPVPVAAGNIVALSTSQGSRARVLTTAMQADAQYAGMQRFVHHAVTCKEKPGGRFKRGRSSSDEDGAR